MSKLDRVDELGNAYNKGFLAGQHKPLISKEAKNEINNLKTCMSSIKDDMNEIKVNLAEMPQKIIEAIDEKYVSKDSFLPVRNVAYGTVSTVVAMLIGLVIWLLTK